MMSVVGVLNGLLARSSMHDIHQQLMTGYGATEYARWVVRDLLRQGYVTPNNLFTNWNGAFASLIYLLGLLIVISLGFILWRKKSLELLLSVYNKSPEFVLFFKLGTFFIIIAIYASFIILSLYVYFLMMRWMIPTELITESGNLPFRLFTNVQPVNLFFWFSLVTLAFGVLSVLTLLTQTIRFGFPLGCFYALAFMDIFFRIIFFRIGLGFFAFFSIGILISYVLAWLLLIRKQKSYKSSFQLMLGKATLHSDLELDD